MVWCRRGSGGYETYLEYKDADKTDLDGQIILEQEEQSFFKGNDGQRKGLSKLYWFLISDSRTNAQK